MYHRRKKKYYKYFQNCNSEVTEDSSIETSKYVHAIDPSDDHTKFSFDKTKTFVELACTYPKVANSKNMVLIKQGVQLDESCELLSIMKEYNAKLTPDGFFSTDKMLQNNLNENMELKINKRKQEMYQLKNPLGCNLNFQNLSNVRKD